MVRLFTILGCLLFWLWTDSIVQAREQENAFTLEAPTQYSFSTKGKTVLKTSGVLASVRFNTKLGFGFDLLETQYLDPELSEVVTIEQEYLNINYRLFRGFFDAQAGAGLGSSEAYCGSCSNYYKVGSTLQLFIRGQVNFGNLGLSFSSGFTSGSVLGKQTDTGAEVISYPGINTTGQYFAMGAKFWF